MYVVKRVMVVEVPGKRCKWKLKEKNDKIEKGLMGEETQDQAARRRNIGSHIKVVKDVDVEKIIIGIDII